MAKKCNQYSQEIISLFVDNELDPDKTEEVLSHVRLCQDCTDQVTKFRKLSRVFDAHTTQQFAQVKAVFIIRRARPFTIDQGILGRLFKGMRDHLYVKLASLAAVATLLILAVFQGPSQIGPSAIVKSLDTTASSVMIIETPTEKHTIIWFSET